MSKYPIYIELSGRRVVVIGAGVVAARKVEVLSGAGARVVVVAEKVSEVFEQTCQKPNIELIISNYSGNYLAEATLAVAATNDMKLNRQVYEDCQKLGVLCNVVDDPELCDFYVPAVVRRGDLQIAISTAGKCPAYAGHLRKKLEDMFTDDHSQFLVELEVIRQKVIADIENGNERKAVLGELVKDKSFDYFVENGPDAWHRRAGEIINKKKLKQKRV